MTLIFLIEVLSDQLYPYSETYRRFLVLCGYLPNHVCWYSETSPFLPVLSGFLPFYHQTYVSQTKICNKEKLCGN